MNKERFRFSASALREPWTLEQPAERWQPAQEGASLEEVKLSEEELRLRVKIRSFQRHVTRAQGKTLYFQGYKLVWGPTRVSFSGVLELVPDRSPGYRLSPVAGEARAVASVAECFDAELRVMWDKHGLDGLRVAVKRLP